MIEFVRIQKRDASWSQTGPKYPKIWFKAQKNKKRIKKTKEIGKILIPVKEQVLDAFWSQLYLMQFKNYRKFKKKIDPKLWQK